MFYSINVELSKFTLHTHSRFNPKGINRFKLNKRSHFVTILIRLMVSVFFCAHFELIQCKLIKWRSE